MVDRNEAADAGRGNSPSQTKQTVGYLYVPPNPQGKWLPAYSGANSAFGFTAKEYDPDIGSAGCEVGNDTDSDYDG